MLKKLIGTLPNNKGVNKMKAGRSNYDIGTRIIIQNIKDKEDLELNGLKGTLTHPFGCFLENYVGVYLDNGNKCNLDKGEFKNDKNKKN